MAFLQRTMNRGSVSTGYDIDNSLKFESDNTERVNKAAGTISGAGNRKTFTISFWTKRTEINGVKQYLFEAGNSDANDDRFTLRFGTGDTFDIQSQSSWLITNRIFRDTSAWYHFVIKVDTTDGTAANRIKLYVNGVEETSFSTDNRSSINQNHDFPVNNTEDHIIGNSQIEGSKYYNGYIAEWIQLDGTAAAPTSFGEFDDDSGIWKPKDPSALSFGTNGFWLDFEDSSNLGNDASGGTDFTLTNITAADQSTDTCTNNFATLNRLFKYPSSQVINEGATKVARTSGSGLNKTFISNIAVTAGKWYAEFKPTAGGSNYVVGIMPISTSSNVALDGNHLGNSDFTGSLGYYSPDGSMLAAGNSANGSFGNSYTGDDIIGVALDMDNRKVYFSKNGTYQNSQDPTNGTNAITLTDTSDGYHIGFTYDTSGTVECNFGGYHVNTLSSAAADGNGFGSFEYAPPTGYYALCGKNLAEFGGTA